MKHSFLVSVVALASFTAMAAEGPVLGTETARISYSLGHQIGQDFRQQGVELTASSVVQGIRDGFSGAEPKLSSAQMSEVLLGLKRKIVVRQQGLKEEERAR